MQQGAHFQVQVVAQAGQGREKPALVDGVHFSVAVELLHDLQHHPFQLRIALAEHGGQRFNGVTLRRNGKFAAGLRGDGEQSDIVVEQGVDLASLQRGCGFAHGFEGFERPAAAAVFVDVNDLVAGGSFEHAQILAPEAAQARDAAAFTNHQRRAGIEIGKAKSHLFAPRLVVGGAGAFHVDFAIDDGGNARGFKHGHSLHLQLGQFQMGGNACGNALANVRRVACCSAGAGFP